MELKKHGITLRIDRKNQVIYLLVNPENTGCDRTDAEEFGEHGVLFDIDEKGQLIGIEILM